ncbi:MAG TPA: hypothetical protein VEY71_05980 [Chitinophagales bacterium]|nr:hypothetical protein [Chitinophagales bacterium]
MHRIVSCVILFLACVGCKRTTEGTRQQFEVRTDTVEIPKRVKAVAYDNGNFICLTDSGVIVLDSLLNKNLKSESSFDGIKPFWLFNVHDTAWLITKSELYQLLQDTIRQVTRFEYLTQIRVDVLKHRYPLWQDYEFFVYGGCEGEWGGSVFFRDNRTRKIYSMPASCPLQVIPQSIGYLVCAYSNADISNFITIRDPTSLVELSDSFRYYSNWWSEDERFKDTLYLQSLSGVSRRRRMNSMNSHNSLMLSFMRNDSLFSVYSHANALTIAYHNTDSLRTLDTLLHTKDVYYADRTFQQGETVGALCENREGNDVIVTATDGNIRLIKLKIKKPL